MCPAAGNFVTAITKPVEMIKNIIFDLGGVLLDLDRNKVIEAYEAMGFAEADELLNNFLQKGIFMRLEKGTAGRYDIYEYIRRSTGRNIPARSIDDALNNFICGLSPYKLRMLDRLGQDYRLYVLSNTNEIMLPEIARIWFTQEGKTMDSYFDGIFLSYEIRMLKPEPEIFEKVASEAGILPSETLFIDDGKHNTDAAAALGFRVYRPNEKEDLRVALQKELDLASDYFGR